ncbi:MAG: CDP-alcohol phosphatidyltransferase family protein, partial [Gemmiger sp.]
MPRRRTMNLPNKLTMARVFLVPVFMIFAGMGAYGTAAFVAQYYLIAGVVFAVASFTDFLDGHIAR